jgi:hypothetical protein
MKSSSGIVIVALIAIFASAISPAGAACGGNPEIATDDGTNRSFIWTQNYFVPYYFGAGYPPWMMNPGNPPVSPEFSGVFWALGTGDPATGLGDDNGTFSQDNWFYYYSPAPNWYFAGEIDTSWAETGIDGCLDNAGATGMFDGDECTCILMSDQDGTDGYFAIASAMVDGANDTYFDMPGSDGNGNAGPIILMPIPKPYITNTQVEPGTLHIDLTVTVAPFTAGVYAKDGCDCGPVGFKVMSMTIPLGDPPPDDRNASLWTELELTGGGGQTVTPFGSSVTVRSNCGGGNNDVFLATGLVFDSGFAPSVVSINSTRIECGPNLANPLEMREERQLPRAGMHPGRRPSSSIRGEGRGR